MHYLPMKANTCSSSCTTISLQGLGVLEQSLVIEGPTSATNLFANLMAKYVVTDKHATAYHTQSYKQVKVSNRELKRILQATIISSRKDWSNKMNNVLWDYKKPIGTFPHTLVF